MWWIQEWHVWASLMIGLLGLGVSIAAWVYAAKARDKAVDVENALDGFKTEFERGLEEERLRRITPPATNKPASFVAVYMGQNTTAIKNVGTGTAYDVWLHNPHRGVGLHSATRWEKIVPGEEIRIVTSYKYSGHTAARMNILWREFAGGEHIGQEIEIEVAGDVDPF